MIFSAALSSFMTDSEWNPFFQLNVKIFTKLTSSVKLLFLKIRGVPLCENSCARLF